MKEMQRIKRLIIPLLKGLPIIVCTFLMGLFIARKVIKYSIPKYQSIAKIKLDDAKYGVSGNNLYEDFDVFSSENKIETEAEILQSPLLIGKTIDAMKLDVLVLRIGVIKTAMLYQDNPFQFEYNSFESKLFDEKYLLKVNGKHFIIENEDKVVQAESTFGIPFFLNGDSLTIHVNESVIKHKNITTEGIYRFEIKSRNRWIDYLNKQLDVKAIDKEIPVLRVVVKSENPDFSVDFANELCTVYVEDYIYNKSLAATKTLSFIDERMADLEVVLKKSENSLEGYKITHSVVNTRQETETGLRELSKLKLQLINLEMEEKSIVELDAYISNGDYYEETAINFGFGDLLLTELVKKLKLYTDEKRDLLVKYTENDSRIINVQGKIDDVEAYIKEAITQNKKNIQTKRLEIETYTNTMSRQFDDIPTREKEMRILERDFQINESVYTFLAQKKLEAQIASSALMSFHRIIQPATTSREPISPNKVLITFVSCFLGLFAGILIIYGGKVVRGKILSKSDVENLTAVPVIGVLTKTKNKYEMNREFVTLATSLQMRQSKTKQTIVITSSTKFEGKSYVSMNLANTYSNMGNSVAFLDLNPFNPAYKESSLFTLQDLLQPNSSQLKLLKADAKMICKIGLKQDGKNATLSLAHKNMAEVMKNLQQKFDYVIIDTPGSVITIDALCMLKYADLSLYIIRTKLSKAQYVSNVDTIQEDYGFNHMKIVLNGVHASTNYSGNFNGSQLHYAEVPKGFFKKMWYYFLIYSK